MDSSLDMCDLDIFNISIQFSADHGVLAYARKPIHRERPNERFLLGTIRSVAFGRLPLALRICMMPLCSDSN